MLRATGNIFVSPNSFPSQSTQGTCKLVGEDVECSIGSIATGQSVTITTVVIPRLVDDGTATPPTGTFTRTCTATVSGSEEDPNAANNTAKVDTTVEKYFLSGPLWSNRFPNSTDVNDLIDPFKTNADGFIKALRAANAGVSIGTTYRPDDRAWLMHHAWRVGYGKATGNFKREEPDAVPPKTGVNICWMHRDASGKPAPTASIKAAQQMVASYEMSPTQPAAYPSNHTGRTAIDMTITWTGNLTIKKGLLNGGDGKTVTIKTGPKTGGTFGPPKNTGNTQLHAIGKTYGLTKLVSDPPHWSANGK